jgi:CHASE2 domain-containing sensor protein
MHRLQTHGIACVEIELSGIVSHQMTAQQLYGGIIQELVSGFQLEVNRRTWLLERDDLPPVQQLSTFIEEVLLAEISQNIVIFIDEIDSVLSLNFPVDEFFALIRGCYNKRAIKSDYRRLTFVLLGVAAPYDLIQDNNCTPFNIGQAIELKGFQFQEAQPLAQGLVGKVSNPKIVLQEVLAWTGGQPFLTQKLCRMIVTSETSIPDGGEAQWVEQLVRSRIIENWESQDEPEHLRTIRDRILRNDRASKPLLKLYQKILQQGKIAAKKCPEHMQLRLSGLVIQQQGKLTVYNRIYKSVFDSNWLSKQLNEQQPSSPVLSVRTVLLASVIVTALVMGVRQTGVFQPLELKALDQQMRLRPSEGLDQRLLLVKVTEEDIKKYRQPLPDVVLAKLLAKLEQYQPRVIGLDIYRDNSVNYRDVPVEPNYTDLLTQLRRNNRLVPICKVSSASDSGISPLPGIPVERLGFSNVLEDSDRTIRRHLLYQTLSSTSPCKTPYALNLQLAFQYLEAEGISRKFTRKGEGDLQLGNTVFKDLESRAGGYQRYDARGQQILLNYRASKQVAQEVTLSEILNGQFDPNWINNRVVLIGVTAVSVKDNFSTPYGERRGLLIQAEMVSQILSAVLDRRPLLQPLPQWGDALWIWGWSLVGGLLACRFRSIPLRMLGGSTAFGALYGLCFVFLTQGDWVPLVPPAIALVTTGRIVVVYTPLQTQRSH